MKPLAQARAAGQGLREQRNSSSSRQSLQLSPLFKELERGIDLQDPWVKLCQQRRYGLLLFDQTDLSLNMCEYFLLHLILSQPLRLPDYKPESH